MNEFIQNYFQKFSNVDEFSLKNNMKYFESLYAKFLDAKELELIIHEPETGIHSNVIPLPILDKSKYPHIQEYDELKTEDGPLNMYNLVLCKMHAGLGSSVKRKDLLFKTCGRKNLGSKGTDLFIEIDGEKKSLAELQLFQTKLISESKIFNKVILQNLVNEETVDEVGKLKNHLVTHDILQMKMPTILEGELTSDRVAPAGHAFLGFSLLTSIFTNENIENDLIVIGNGEDLNSTPDNKILSWVVEKEIPLTMITTTKLEKDKKGGQISVVTGDVDYVTIIEKAQAEKANQLSYFEQLGLRKKDQKSLFNTNIVVINARALKDKLNKLDIGQDQFSQIISPDLIKNNKTQNGKTYTQLEGAIGSTMLNLDKYFRLNLGESILSFLNLDPVTREKFFIPIKMIEDFHELVEKYEYNTKTGRFDLKEN